MNDTGQNTEQEYLGQRFKYLRKYYSQTILNLDQDITQTELAAKCGLTQNKIHHLEDGGKGRIETFLAVLNFYVGIGFNPLWVITPDNSDIPVFIKNEELNEEIVEPASPKESEIYYQEKLLDDVRKKEEFMKIIDRSFDELFG